MRKRMLTAALAALLLGGCGAPAEESVSTVLPLDEALARQG